MPPGSRRRASAAHDPRQDLRHQDGRAGHAALEAGADYLGFIFYPPSHRYVEPASVGEIVAACRARFGGPDRWQAVGVFVDVPLAEAQAICAEAQARSGPAVRRRGHGVRRSARAAGRAGGPRGRRRPAARLDLAGGSRCRPRPAGHPQGRPLRRHRHDLSLDRRPLRRVRGVPGRRPDARQRGRSDPDGAPLGGRRQQRRRARPGQRPRPWSARSSRRFDVSMSIAAEQVAEAEARRPGYFGEFGGQFVPEVLMPAIRELEVAYAEARDDPAFQAELGQLLRDFVGRPTPLYEAPRLCEGGRLPGLPEARRPGPHRRPQDQQRPRAGAARRQRWASSGSSPRPAPASTAWPRPPSAPSSASSASSTWARRTSAVRRSTSSGWSCSAPRSSRSRAAPAPSRTPSTRRCATGSPTSARRSTCSARRSARTRTRPSSATSSRSSARSRGRRSSSRPGALPDAVVACVGGGSNAIGMFAGFVDDPSVKLIGVEPGGRGMGPSENAATLVTGSVGVLHGTRTMVLQDENGQILGTHSVSAGLDYPGVGPEHSFLQASGRARYVAIDDQGALQGFRDLCRLEGIIPALEPSHAVAYLTRSRAGARAGRPDRPEPVRARRQGHRQLPRGDRRALHLSRARCRERPRQSTRRRLRAAQAGGPDRLLPVRDGRLPDRETSARLLNVVAEAGADGVELGIPFSDPLADGVTVQRAGSGRARKRRFRGATRWRSWPSFGSATRRPIVMMSYVNPLLAYGFEQLCKDAARVGIDGFIIPDLSIEEAVAFQAQCASAGLHYIYLVAPTSTEERLRAWRAGQAVSSTASRWWARLARAPSCRTSLRAVPRTGARSRSRCRCWSASASRRRSRRQSGREG